MNRPDREQRQLSKSRNAAGGASAAADEGGRSSPPPIVDLDFLRGLISAVDDSGIDSLEISRGGTRIRIAKTAGTTSSLVQGAATVQHEVHAAPPAAAPTPSPTSPASLGESIPVQPVPAVNNWVDIKSPMVGTFYRSPSPEAPVYVEVGSRVVKGQTLCILEAMKLMNELESDISGIVREIVVENGEPVEYGQVLYRLEPEA